jgi:hypothetical protein
MFYACYRIMCAIPYSFYRVVSSNRRKRSEGVAYKNEMAILSILSIKSVKKIFSIPKDITLAYRPRIAFCDSTVVSLCHYPRLWVMGSEEGPSAKRPD